MLFLLLALTAVQSHGRGPSPALPAPDTAASVTRLATLVPWPDGRTPTAPAGFEVSLYADGFQRPRWLHVLSNGDVLVAESANAGGWRDTLMPPDQVAARWASGNRGHSANRITLLRDTDHDGRAERRIPLLWGLNQPVGMLYLNGWLYVANTDALVRFPYQEGQTEITAPATKVVDLPGGPLNHHWTKNVIASPDGAKLYVTAGSNSNVGENGMPAEEGRAAIWEVDRASGQHRIFASGLRNPNGLGWEPTTKALWTAVNERDEIGSDLVPDYMTSVQDGGFYGWPYSYYGQHVDERVSPQKPDLVAKAIVPDYALGSHTGSLGLTFSDGANLGPGLAHGAFVGQHGSWNRKPFSGYRVIFVPFRDDRPSGAPRELLTGFLSEDGKAQGRPVGVAIDKRGGLLVADDVGNTVWRVSQ
jgi:glucose/arabinose dehydrogenase